MIDKCLREIRLLDNFRDAIIKSVVLDSRSEIVEVKIITDKAFQSGEREKIFNIIRKIVPSKFGCKVEVNKLSPDEEMVKQKITETVKENFKALSVTLTEEDIEVRKTDKGFEFKLSVMRRMANVEMCDAIIKNLKRNFCGEFSGECVENKRDALDIEVDEEQENVDFEMPARYFDIANFTLLEGNEKQKKAVYISDLNFEGENVVVCGTIDEIGRASCRERV